MATLSQLQTWLTEAETARHQLATGAAVVEIMRDGRRLQYRNASLPQLEAYIRTLESDIEKATADAAGRPRRSAIGVDWH